MSVLVKGMEMPENCDSCWALDEYGDYPLCRLTGEQRGYNFRIREQRMEHCPLVDVPTPHGRLIDADAFLATIRPCSASDEFQACTFLTVKRLLFEHIEAAPTVMEAEE